MWESTPTKAHTSPEAMGTRRLLHVVGVVARVVVGIEVTMAGVFLIDKPYPEGQPSVSQVWT